MASSPRLISAWLFIVATVYLFALTTASSSTKVHCATSEECCNVCGDESYRCARGPCSSNIVTKGFFFISLPLHFSSVWDVVFVAYGMVPSLVPVVLALELIFIKRTWTRVLAFVLIPIIAAINTAILVPAFGECEDCMRPCGTCLSSKGFPSGHSANSLGMCLWILLETLLGVGANWPKRTQIYITLANMLIFLPVPYSRVYLGDHTLLQIVIGGIDGVVFAVLYFVIVRSLLGRKLDGASRWLAKLRYFPIVIENDFYAEPSPRSDDVELAALKKQSHPTYSS